MKADRNLQSKHFKKVGVMPNGENVPRWAAERDALAKVIKHQRGQLESDKVFGTIGPSLLQQFKVDRALAIYKDDYFQTNYNTQALD